jgi:hypothetical protein
MFYIEWVLYLKRSRDLNIIYHVAIHVYRTKLNLRTWILEFIIFDNKFYHLQTYIHLIFQNIEEVVKIVMRI